MKRKIEVRAEGVVITAHVNTNGSKLVGREVQYIVDVLADRLQQAAAELPYLPTPRSRVNVK